jgi:glycosyltransferase involved in cell wall biosynthesis
MIKCTIVVPIYNLDWCIARCLSSLLNEDFDGLMVVCVLDGCSDESEEVVRSFVTSFNNLKVIKLNDNVGLVEARKIGVRFAEGEYLCFVDGDDYVRPGFISDFLKVMNKGVDLVCAGYKELNDGTYITCLPNYLGHYEVEVFLDGRLDLCYNLDFSEFGITTYLWNKMFRLSVFRTFLDSVDSRLTIGEDFVFLLNYLKISSSIYFIHSSSYVYVQHERSMVKSQRNNVLKKLNVLYESCEELAADLSLRAQESIFRFVSSTYFIRCFRPRPLLEEEFDRMINFFETVNDFAIIGNGTFAVHVRDYLQEKGLAHKILAESKNVFIAYLNTGFYDVNLVKKHSINLIYGLRNE